MFLKVFNESHSTTDGGKLCKGKSVLFGNTAFYGFFRNNTKLFEQGVATGRPYINCDQFYSLSSCMYGYDYKKDLI